MRDEIVLFIISFYNFVSFYYMIIIINNILIIQINKKIWIIEQKYFKINLEKLR